MNTISQGFTWIQLMVPSMSTANRRYLFNSLVYMPTQSKLLKESIFFFKRNAAAIYMPLIQLKSVLEGGSMFLRHHLLAELDLHRNIVKAGCSKVLLEKSENWMYTNKVFLQLAFYFAHIIFEYPSFNVLSPSFL